MSETARDVLDRRLAAGEITLEQYDLLASRLSATPPPLDGSTGPKLAPATAPAATMADPIPTALPTAATGLPSASYYEASWRAADLIVLGLAVLLPTMIRGLCLWWIGNTVSGMSFAFRVSGLTSRIDADRPDVLLTAVLSVLILVLSIAITYTVAKVVSESFLEVSDKSALDVSADLRAVVVSRNAVLSMIRVDVLTAQPGVVLKPRLRNLFGLVLGVAYLVLDWLF